MTVLVDCGVKSQIKLTSPCGIIAINIEGDIFPDSVEVARKPGGKCLHLACTERYAT